MGTRVVGGVPLKVSIDGIDWVASEQLFDGTNAIAANMYSVPIWVERVGTLALHVSCPATGSPVGSFALQGSCDASKQEGNNLPDPFLVNWATLSFTDESTGGVVQSKAVSGASSFIATIPLVSCRWLRFVWTFTSGSALLTVKPQMKAVA